MKQVKYETKPEKIMERQNKIIKLAQQQHTYQIWSELQEKTKQDFDDYLRQQPPDVQSTLLSYVDSCLMVGQRLLNIACEYMDFIDPSLRK